LWDWIFPDFCDKVLFKFVKILTSSLSYVRLVLDVYTVLVVGIFIYPGIFVDFQKEECSHGAGEVPMGRSLKWDILLVDNWYASSSQIIYIC